MVCIIIPIYKNSFSENEQISFDQYKKVLSKHATFIIAPEGLELPSEIIELPQIKIIRFPKHYFSGIPGYNELLLSAFFYERFNQYKYMFIYQLDAYVFKDELIKWCNQGYDYIGAPWFKNFEKGTSKEDLWSVGNGGLSLRKIDSFIRVIKDQTKFEIIKDLFWELRHFQFSFSKYFHQGKLIGNCQRYLKSYYKNEDQFWGLEAIKFKKDFNIAPIEKAIQFSFENSPEILLSLNNNELPFGCHKWENELPFWQKHIPELN